MRKLADSYKIEKECIADLYTDRFRYVVTVFHSLYDKSYTVLKFNQDTSIEDIKDYLDKKFRFLRSQAITKIEWEE